ncbi:hypothetical protein Q4577_09985 [Marinovum sp. 2_MG-2023]|uniref:hypothetical protein n=1 Tax=Roseobacteraceae TaxID=2854170 RepID=UPI001FD381BD|nr:MULTISPECIES: hypothetical protein [Roseobacteraceae]MCJ7871947.1 hypothetical protein [Phaeobacter sp. J2-8]MDO6730350.1 hypothetical protein [Marinovum sp. 2_MG-2023]MDO6778330.1 hypothetical protein [Marinovum sp. 1_MG-2023]
MDAVLLTLLGVAIFGVTVLLARRAIRADQGKTRGSEPGSGYHVLHTQYSSGLGGQSHTTKVPRDPQEYAKRFIPKGKSK